VKREAGYEKVKKVLSRWESVVESNRVADQLEFPAQNDSIQVHETNIFSSVTKPKTDIEKKVFAMLQENGYMAKKLEVKFTFLLLKYKFICRTQLIKNK